VPIGGAVACGAKPGLIVRVRSGSGRLFREFHRFCQFQGIHVRPVQTVREDGRADWFEVIATVDSLERLIGHPSIVDFHYILSTRPPVGGQGAGEVTDRVRKTIREARMHKPDRLALEETERRAKLTTEERLDIELDEARQLAAAL
jgi:hypothetical protein